MRNWIVLGLAGAALALPAWSSVVGDFNFANCPGGGVVITATSFDFFPPMEPATPHNGCLFTGGATALTSATSTIGAGALGSINDIGFDPATVSNAGFISFTGISLDLTTLGPGTGFTACTASLAPGNPSCSITAGSPLILTPTPTGTAITLSLSGTARDASTVVTTWQGVLTTQVAELPPAAVQQILLRAGNNSINSTFSFAGSVAAAVPEDASFLLIASGLFVVSFGLKRKLRA